MDHLDWGTSSVTNPPPIMASDNPHEDDDDRMLSKGMSK